MAKQRATLDKKAPPEKAAPANTKPIDLCCDTCHSHWTEAVLRAWQKCPFLDCKGTLTTTAPPSPPKAPRPPKGSLATAAGRERVVTLREVAERMERMRFSGTSKECHECGTYVRFSAPSRDEWERLQLDIEIALRREKEAVAR